MSQSPIKLTSDNSLSDRKTLSSQNANQSAAPNQSTNNQQISTSQTTTSQTSNNLTVTQSGSSIPNTATSNPQQTANLTSANSSSSNQSSSTQVHTSPSNTSLANSTQNIEATSVKQVSNSNEAKILLKSTVQQLSTTSLDLVNPSRIMQTLKVVFPTEHSQVSLEMQQQQRQVQSSGSNPLPQLSPQNAQQWKNGEVIKAVVLEVKNNNTLVVAVQNPQVSTTSTAKAQTYNAQVELSYPAKPEVKYEKGQQLVLTVDKPQTAQATNNIQLVLKTLPAQSQLLVQAENRLNNSPSSLAPLLASVDAIHKQINNSTQAQDIYPKEFINAVKKLVADFSNQQQLSTGQGVKQAVSQSGQFLEKNLQFIPANNTSTSAANPAATSSQTQVAQPQATQSQAAQPQATQAQAAQPQATQAQATQAQATQAQATQTQVAQPQASQTQAAQPQAVQPQAAQPQAAQATQAQATQAQAIQPQATQAQPNVPTSVLTTVPANSTAVVTNTVNPPTTTVSNTEANLNNYSVSRVNTSIAVDAAIKTALADLKTLTSQNNNISAQITAKTNLSTASIQQIITPIIQQLSQLQSQQQAVLSFDKVNHKGSAAVIDILQNSVKSLQSSSSKQGQAEAIQNNNKTSANENLTSLPKLQHIIQNIQKLQQLPSAISANATPALVNTGQQLLSTQIKQLQELLQPQTNKSANLVPNKNDKAILQSYVDKLITVQKSFTQLQQQISLQPQVAKQSQFTQVAMTVQQMQTSHQAQGLTSTIAQTSTAQPSATVQSLTQAPSASLAAAPSQVQAQIQTLQTALQTALNPQPNPETFSDFRVNIHRLLTILKEMPALTTSPSLSSSTAINNSLDLLLNSASDEIPSKLKHAQIVKSIDQPLNQLSHFPVFQKQMIEQLEKSLSRIMTTQVSSREQGDPQTALSVELPVRFLDKTHILQMKIQAENKKLSHQDEKIWTANLAFELPSLGPIRIYITLEGSHVAIQFWAEQKESQQIFQDKFSILSGRLREDGFIISQLQAFHGVPEDAQKEQQNSDNKKNSLGLIDERV